MQRIIVIGGGIAGLAAAHRIDELVRLNGRSIDIKLLEASGRLGGAIATERVGEFLVEAGPDSFISEKPWALNLCERIGLSHRLVSTQSAYQKIYIVHHGRLVPLPEGFFLLAPTRLWPFIQTPLFSWPGKLRMAAELLLPRGELPDDESLGAFVRRRFGGEALERVAQPLLGGIYAADPDRLSLGATMPRFKEMERERRSVICAMWSAQRQRAKTAETGSGARLEPLRNPRRRYARTRRHPRRAFAAGSVRLNCAARALTLSANRRTGSHVGDSEVLDADAVIFATPASAAANCSRPRNAADELKRSPTPRPPPSASLIAAKIFPSAGQLRLRRARHRKTQDHGLHIQQPEISRTRAGALHLLRAFVGGSLQPN